MRLFSFIWNILENTFFLQLLELGNEINRKWAIIKMVIGNLPSCKDNCHSYSHKALKFIKYIRKFRIFKYSNFAGRSFKIVKFLFWPKPGLFHNACVLVHCDRVLLWPNIFTTLNSQNPEIVEIISTFGKVPVYDRREKWLKYSYHI